MKSKNILLIILLLTAIATKSYCSDADSLKTAFNLGIAGGISQGQSLSGDLYIGALIPIKREKIEANLGYSFFLNETSYQDIEGLEFQSHGLFIEGNFHFNMNMYAGLKFAYNLNWVDEHSQTQFESNSSNNSPTFFAGKSIYTHLGFFKELTKSFSMKVQGQVGIHNYKMDEGKYWQLFGDSDESLNLAQFGIETKNQILYNLSIGLIYKLK